LDWNITRFCSATLVQAGDLAFKDGTTTYGYEGGVFLSGEEDGDSGYGRGFAFDMDGNGKIEEDDFEKWFKLLFCFTIY
jgi:hypothetical protein